MKTRQLTWNQANEIAKRAATTAQGFGTASAEQIEQWTRAAMIALELAGCLDECNRRDAEWHSRKASQASKEHRRLCRKLGISC